MPEHLVIYLKNAEFDAARENQGQIEDRIKEMSQLFKTLQIISSKASSDEIRLGSKVEFTPVRGKKRETVTIVGSLEADPFQSMISNNSPLGTALLGANVGEVVTVAVAKKYDVKINKVSN